MTVTPHIKAARKRYDAWLDNRAGAPVDIMTGLRDARTLSLDAAGLKARGWSDLPDDWVPDDGHLYAGGYGENRAIYDTPIFQSGDGEPRTLHLGLDIFAPAGTPVHAPLDGRIHSFHVNDNAKDYGPTLILEHTLEPGLTLWTLYGHLSADSVSGLTIGTAVNAGDEIARLGANDVNGGWAPHLHFQLMLDMLGKSGDFQGVCRLSERDDWLTLCPDPRPLLGLTSS